MINAIHDQRSSGEAQQLGGVALAAALQRGT
jgi:hypothetical protein